MYIHVSHVTDLLHHIMCDWPPLHLHVCQVKRTSVVVKVWKWPHCSVNLRHISICSTVCVGSQYDTGASTVSGLCWSWLKFKCYLFSMQCSTIQIVQIFWGIRNWKFFLPRCLQCSQCLHCQRHIVNRPDVWWLTYQILDINPYTVQLHCYTSLDTATENVLRNSLCMVPSALSDLTYEFGLVNYF